MLIYMKQVLVQVDDALYARLEEAAPGQSRRRSAFIREALLRAVWALEEERTAAAYQRQPDDAPAHFDASLWEDGAPRVTSRKAKAIRPPAQRTAKARSKVRGAKP